MKKFLLKVCVVLLTVTGYSHAQVNTAQVSGQIMDAGGAVIPNAVVTATNSSTKVDTVVKSNKDGFFTITSLPVGPYSFSVTMPGFEKYARQGVTLTTAQQLELDVTLKVGSASETVEVTTGAPLVQTRDSDVTQFIEEKSVDSLPLGNRRTLNIMQTVGGAVFLNDNPGGSQPTYSLAGGRVQSQMTWLDGGLTQNFRIAAPQQSIDPPIEVIKEIQVLVSTYPAQYGASGGGVVIESSKSGTNRLHGSAYEYLRNDDANAAGYFAPQLPNGQPNKPELRYNVYGATVGGPMKRDKAFFFFGFESVRQNLGSTLTLTVPTALERMGNFSQILTTTPIAGASTDPCDGSTPVVGQLYDPTTTRVVGGVTCRNSYPGNIISTSTDSTGKNILLDYPAPTNTALANNSVGNIVTMTNTDFFFIKLEDELTHRDHLQGRYMYYQNNVNATSIYPDRGPDPNSFPDGSTTLVYATDTHTFSATKVNNTGFSFYRRTGTQFSYSSNKGYAAKLGLTGVPSASFPGISPAGGYTSIGTGSQGNGSVITQEQYTDDYTWLLGRHSVKLGGEFRGSHSHGVSVAANSSGSFAFVTQTTGDPNAAGTSILTGTGNGLASLLVGAPGGTAGAFTISNGLPVDRRSQYVGAYAQDDWTVNQRLTLNLGIRWEYDRPIYDGNNRLNGFDSNQINPVSGTPGVVKFAGIDYSTEAWDPNYKNFSPRLGFAYKPFNNEFTAIRGGYGIYFGPPIDNTSWAGGTLGYSTQSTVNSPDQIGTAPFYLRNGVPGYTLVSPALNDSYGAVAAPYTAASTTVTYFPRSRPTEYYHQFNLTVEHQLNPTLVVTLTGIGTLGRRLSSNNQPIDQITPANVAAGHTTQAYRPYPQFSGVTLIAPANGTSNYFGGIIKIEKRYAHGFNFVSTYTQARQLADTNDNANASAGNLGQDNGPYSNYYNRGADYGRTDNDVERRFTFNTVYELPFGPEKRWANQHTILDDIVGGWALSDLTAVQSGPAETAIDATNNCNCFSSGSQRPNLSGNPNQSRGTRGISAAKPWFNTGLFSQPAPGTFGNESLGAIVAPGLVDFDASLLRTITLPRGFAVELRVEGFNIFNHTNFAPANTTYGSSSFGTISSISGNGVQSFRNLEAGARISF